MKSARETAVELAALLTLCQTLQSEKTGWGATRRACLPATMKRFRSEL